MGNAVGSREVPPIKPRSKKDKILSLTKREYDILIGSVLGDGYITKLGRIQLEQGENQRRYLEWKYKMLKRVASTTVVSAKRRMKSGTITKSFRFWTRQYFHKWRDIFYPKGKKLIPGSVAEILSPLSLAVWFMDDGFLRKDDAIAIATDKFSPRGLKLVVADLDKKYGVHASIVKSGRLYLGKESTGRFVKIIRPYVVPSMLYKLP